MPEIICLQTNSTQRIEVVNGKTSISSRYTDATSRIISGSVQQAIVENGSTSLVSSNNGKINVVETESYILKERVGGIPIPTPDFGGFGYRRVGDTQFTAQNPLLIPEGVRTLVLNNGGINLNNLRLELDDQISFHDNKVWPTDAGDVFLVRLSFQISSIVDSNFLKVELDIGSVLQDHRQPFAVDAGTPELVTINFLVYSLDRFIQNGGSFFITTQMESSIWGVNMLFVPVSIGL